MLGENERSLLELHGSAVTDSDGENDHCSRDRQRQALHCRCRYLVSRAISKT